MATIRDELECASKSKYARDKARNEDYNQDSDDNYFPRKNIKAYRVKSGMVRKIDHKYDEFERIFGHILRKDKSRQESKFQTIRFKPSKPVRKTDAEDDNPVEEEKAAPDCNHDSSNKHAPCTDRQNADSDEFEFEMLDENGGSAEDPPYEVEQTASDGENNEAHSPMSARRLCHNNINFEHFDERPKTHRISLFHDRY